MSELEFETSHLDKQWGCAMNKPGTQKARLRFQRGAVAVMFAALMLLIFGIAAFAIDFARVLVVRNQLQNAADAAALAAAGMLFPLSGGQPNWSAAIDKANSAVGYNGTEGVALVDGTVNAGYWNLVAAEVGPGTRTH